MVSLNTSSMVINGLDIMTVDDDDLYRRLQEMGASVGPIVDSTRKVYQKKLFVLLGGEVPESPTFNGDVEEEEDEYSDSEGEVVTESSSQYQSRVVSQSSSSTTTTVTSVTSPPPSQVTDVRRRFVLSSDGGDDDSELVFDPDLHTPSPRRSLRTVTSSSSETTTYRRLANNGSNFTRPLSTDGMDIIDSCPTSAPGKLSSALRVLVKLIFLALLLALALYIYQNNPTESPLKAIEQLARQALEAAAGEEAASSEGVEQPSPPSPQHIEEAAN